jgi:recombinational DNA repair protein (RecF pathway)
MVEYYTKVLVLSRTPRGDLDGTLNLYTKEFGRVSVKVKSLRKLTSKLSGHLTPGRLANVRIVEMGDTKQVVDALSLPSKTSFEFLKFLDFIRRLSPIGMPDLHLWHELEQASLNGTSDKNTYKRIISIMGYDAKNAVCDNCGSVKIAYFVPRDIMFLCNRCLSDSRLKEDEVFSI